MIDRVTRTVVEDPDNPGELLLELGEDIVAALGWKPGDTVEWIDNGDGTWTIRKKQLTVPIQL